MIRIRLGVALTVVSVLITGCVMAQTSADTGSSVAFGRAGKLKRGINASGWFAQVYDKRGYTPEHFQSWMTADDVVLIKSMGFDHVRLSVDPEPMFKERSPENIPADYLASLDAAVKMIMDHGLAVVIDLHPESAFATRLAKDDDFVKRFATFWRALAQHYSTWDGDRVYLEIMNEPEFSDRYRWMGVQMKLAAAIREGAPKLTMIASGASSDDDDLIFGEPLRDPNVIYNFHFYEPHIFTHQGATWSAYSWYWLRGLRYPSTPESAEQVAARVPDEADRLPVIRYGYDHWDAVRIAAEMKEVAEWARHRGVPVVCNEFGVYREYADPQDRAAWLHDVRAALEQNGIGWAMWDYAGSFGLVVKKDGKTVPDEGVLRALGMK